MNTDNNNMTDGEFFALHSQPELVVGHAYPTLIFPDDLSIYAFPPKPEKYKRQHAVDLINIPTMEWEFDDAVVNEEDEEEDMFDLPELFDEFNIRFPVSHYCWSQEQIEASYTLSVDEIEEAVNKSLAEQYNIAELNKKARQERDREQDIKEDQEIQSSILQQDKEKQDPVQVIKDQDPVQDPVQDIKDQDPLQVIKDRERRCYRELERRRNKSLNLY